MIGLLYAVELPPPFPTSFNGLSLDQNEETTCGAVFNNVDFLLSFCAEVLNDTPFIILVTSTARGYMASVPVSPDFFNGSFLDQNEETPCCVDG